MKKAATKRNQSTLLQTWGKSGKKVTQSANRGCGAAGGSGVGSCTNSNGLNKVKKKSDILLQTNTKKEEPPGGSVIDPNWDIDGFFDDDLDIDESLDLINGGEPFQCAEDTFLDDCFDPNVPHENIKGFDMQFGSTYIYPTNYPVRDYQFSIIKRAMLENTLVVLPTGLGKTFIAAVLIYNFYRWYPQGKLIFMAPTKPLVAQQIEACYNIMGIPQSDTAEMTGSMNPQRREAMWKSKRVFFLTPQVLQNDIGRGSCFAPDVICLVFDEAHRALGNHAYCQVVREVCRYHDNFRVLALSATPGDDMSGVQHVIENLMISHIEIRTEDSADLKKYSFERQVEKIIVPLSDKMKEIKSILMHVMQTVVDRLVSKSAIWQNSAQSISKFALLQAREQWRNSNSTDARTRGVIEGDYALAMSLFHSHDVLQQHGILSCYNFLKGILAGTKGVPRTRLELSRNAKFMRMMEELHKEMEPDEMNLSLNESIMGGEKKEDPKKRLLKSIPKPIRNFSSHPKLQKLEEIVLDHFSKFSQKENEGDPNTGDVGKGDSRIIIFSQYRDSVQEITSVLSQHEPVIRVMSFIGQGAKDSSTSKGGNKGLTQKEQLEVIRKFRSGSYNTIVSTSVGEEGLDIGQVDLIICFDAPSSPLRLIQRMGRTGRKRVGKVIMLVSEGREDQAYKRSLSSKKGIHTRLVNAVGRFEFYRGSRRMIPAHMNPKCYKMSITHDKFQKKGRVLKKAEDKPSSKRKASKSIGDSSGVQIHIQFKKDASFLEDCENNYLNKEFFGEFESCRKCQLNQSINKKEKFCSHVDFKYPLSLASWCPWQTSSQPFISVSHSKRTTTFCKIMGVMEKTKNNSLSEEYETKMKSYFKTDDVICRDNDADEKSVPHKRQKKNDNGKTWRQNYLDNCNNNSSDSDDEIFAAISGIKKSNEKKKNTVRIESDDDEDLKPCSLEKLLEKVDSDQKNKKRQRVRLTKLPKLPTREADIATIEDNQLDFCSQVSMDTLYNRIRKKSDPLLRTLHDELNEKVNEDIIEEEEETNPVLDWLKGMRGESAEQSPDDEDNNTKSISSDTPKNNMDRVININIKDDNNGKDSGRKVGAMLPPTSYPKRKRNIRIADTEKSTMSPPKLPFDRDEFSRKTDDDINRNDLFTNSEEENIDKDDGICGLLPLSTPRGSAKPRKVCVVSPIIRGTVPEPPPDIDLDWCSFDDESRNGNKKGSKISPKHQTENPGSPPLFPESPLEFSDVLSEDDRDRFDLNSASKQERTACNEDSQIVPEPPSDNLDLVCDEDSFLNVQPASEPEKIIELEARGKKNQSFVQNESSGVGMDDDGIDGDDYIDVDNVLLKPVAGNGEVPSKMDQEGSLLNMDVTENGTTNNSEIKESELSSHSMLKSVQESFTQICEKSKWKKQDFDFLDVPLSDSMNEALVDLSSSPPVLSQYNSKCTEKAYVKLSREVPTENGASLLKKRLNVGASSEQNTSSSKTQRTNRTPHKQTDDLPSSQFIQSSQNNKDRIIRKVTNKTSNKLQKFLYKSVECNKEATEEESIITNVFDNDESVCAENDVITGAPHEDYQNVGALLVQTVDITTDITLPEGSSAISEGNIQAVDDGNHGTPPMKTVDTVDGAAISSDDGSPVITKRNKRSSNKNCVISSPVTPPTDKGKCVSNVNGDNVFDVTEGHSSPDDDFSTKKVMTMRKRRKKSLGRNEYIEYEAEDDCHESTVCDETQVNGYVKDSFINDDTQLSPTISLHSTNQRRTGNSSVDMNLIYKQSLLSPTNCPLRFKTPAFKAGRNCFKLANLEEKYNNLDPDEESEAEEVMGLVESDEDFVCSEPEDSKYKEVKSSIVKSTIVKNQYQNKLGKKKLFRTSIIETDETFLNEDDDTQVINADESCFEIKKKPLKRVHKLSDSEDERDPSENKQMKTVQKPWCKTFSVWELPEITFSFRINWHDDEECTAEKSNDSVEKTTIPPLVGGSCIDQASLLDVAPLIIMDSQCLSNNKIPSSLRLKEKCKVIVQGKLGCDYVVSKRAGVLRKTLSQVAGGGPHRPSENSLNESVRSLCELYAKNYIIIEENPVKGNGSKRPSYLTKFYANFLTKLVSADLTILYSENQDETASLIGKLAKDEVVKGFVIKDVLKDDLQQQQMLKSLLHVPKMNYPIAAELVRQCKCFKQLVKHSLEEMKKILCFVPPQQVAEYYFFFQRRFDLTQVGSDKIK